MEHSPSARNLIERAFAQARRSGKPEWWVMAIPVLKNRLLQITGHGFKESDFGVSTFGEFLQSNADVLEIDKSFLPGAVTLKAVEKSERAPGTSAPREDRIREDLWRAILDYSSGNRYVWDANSDVAVMAPEGSGGLFLPTISSKKMAEWKAEFLASVPGDSDEDRLKTWQARSLPTAALPSALHSKWNRFLKLKVQSTLKEWFESNGVPLPSLVHAVVPETNRDETGLFREFVIKCVALMSKEELEKLPIPSSVAFRVSSHR
jgi:hypothetical protein